MRDLGLLVRVFRGDGKHRAKHGVAYVLEISLQSQGGGALKQLSAGVLAVKCCKLQIQDIYTLGTTAT